MLLILLQALLKLLKLNVDLKHINYAVLALGSKEYPDTYCSFGHAVDAWLKANGAHALFNTIEVDNANPSDIQNWNQSLTKSNQIRFTCCKSGKVFDSWTLQQRDLLNPNSLGQPAL